MPFGLESIVEEREARVREAILRLREEASDQARLQMLLNAMAEIREAIASSVVDKVTVTNQDEIKAALHNELNRISKPIIAAIEKLAINKEQIEKIKQDLEVRNAHALDDSFDFQVVRKPKQRFLIENLNDIAFPDSFSVSNLSDLQKNFDDLSSTMRELLNFEIPVPQVTVQPPQVNIPEIRIPEQAINIDLQSVIDALDPLKFLSDRANKPLAVRLSDGQKFIQALKTIVDNQNQQMAAFSQGITEAALRKALKAVQNVGISTSTIFSGNVELTPKFAVIDHATSGDNTIVAAVTGKKIRVLQYVLVASNTVNVRFESGASGTALTGQINLIANTGVSSGFSQIGQFETAADALLNLELSGNVSVDGHLTYVEV